MSHRCDTYDFDTMVVMMVMMMMQNISVTDMCRRVDDNGEYYIDDAKGDSVTDL